MPCINHWCSKLSKVLTIAHNMRQNEKVEIWNPCSVYLQGTNNIPNHYVLMILNRPITLHFQPTFMLNLWKNAVLRVTVDGGTNRWLSWLKLNNCDSIKNVAPDLITGDMDSVSEDVLKYFSSGNPKMKIIKTPNQDETDFTKAIQEVKHHCSVNNITFDTIFVLADTSGRLDQIVGNIHTLFISRDIVPDVKIFILASNSLSWLLREGIHKIEIPLRLCKDQEWCGLIPIGTSCKVTTTGLKWNLSNTLLEFGKLVSTSNTYDCNSSTVTIETDHPLLWSMGIEGLL